MMFGSENSARQVVEGLRELSGRPVAVDWALDKSQYLTKQELFSGCRPKTYSNYL